MNTYRNSIINLINESCYDEAFAYYIENKKNLPFWERKFIFSIIEEGLNYKNSDIVFYAFLGIISEINILLSKNFGFALLDTCSFLSQKYLYFNYYIRWVSPIINIFLLFLLFYTIIKDLLYPYLVFKQSFNFSALGSSLVVGFWIIFDTVTALNPLINDFNNVIQNNYEVRYISNSEINGMVISNMLSSDSEVVNNHRDSLTEYYNKIIKNHDEYQNKNWYEPKKDHRFLVIPYEYKQINISDDFYIDVSNFQWKSFNLSEYNNNNIVVKIIYLKKSKTVLYISCIPITEAND